MSNVMVMVAPKNCRGFSLVELMVALLLGLVLSVGVINLFIEQKSNFLETEESARMQENGRYGLHLLSKEISMSGFYGGQIDLGELETAAAGVITEECAKDIADPLTFVDHTEHATGLGTGNAIPCVLKVANDVSDRSDVIVVRRVSGSPTVFDGYPFGDEDSTQTLAQVINDNEEYLRIVDYGANIAFMQGAGAESGGGIAPGVDWSLWEYETKAFYVNNDDELCQKTLTQFDTTVEECFLQGIEALQIEFGIQSGGSSVQYKADPTTTEMESAVSLRVYLLAKTSLADGGYTDDKTYTLGNLSAYTPNDNYRRRIYTTTVVLRNPVSL